MGPCWAYLGAMLGPCWAHVGPSGGHLGPMLGHLGPSWGQVGPMLGHLGAHLGPSCGYVVARGYPPLIVFSDLCRFFRRAKNTVKYEVFR